MFASVSFTATDLGAGLWRYNYSVKNDTLFSPIEEFTISFPLGSYSDLLALGAPVGWDNVVVQPDPALPADGFFDSLSLTAGIAPGIALDGFSVQFSWLGTGAPGPQPYEIVDPVTFVVLDSGLTSAQTVSPGIPEPATLSLALLAIGALVGKHGRPRNPISPSESRSHETQ